MESRIAVIGIIVEKFDSTEKVNEILHDFRQYVIGRMGLPYEKRKIAVISVVLDAPGDIINTLAGKIGMIEGVSTKTVYSKTFVD